MTKCLDTANVSSYTSIVFPAIGTGHLGYPRDRVAAIMYQTVLNHFRENDGTNVEEVKFVCFNNDSNTIKVISGNFHSRKLFREERFMSIKSTSRS